MVDVTMINCVFCSMVEGEAPSYKIAKTPSLLQYSISILSPKGIVLPKRHVPWWHDLTEEENASFFRMAKRVSQQIMKVLHPDFVCMYARGRKIPHTHVFLVPTYSGMCWTSSSTRWKYSKNPRQR